jgi:AcrR family transcriptional regulator
VAKKKRTAAAAKNTTPRPKMGRPRVGVPPELHGTDEAMLAEHLYSLAEKSGITSDELAKRLGTSTRAVNLYFSGKRIPHFRDWRRIAAAFGLRDVRDLLPKMPIA